MLTEPARGVAIESDRTVSEDDFEILAERSTGTTHPLPPSSAVASLPRHLAYRAMVAPVGMDPDGTLRCIVPNAGYDPSRLRDLEGLLPCPLLAVEAPREEVLGALGAAYGASEDVDSDALHTFIAQPSPPPSLLGRLGRWLGRV